MSDPQSLKQSLGSSSSSSQEDYIKLVEQLLESDEEQKLLSSLQPMFSVLKKLNPSMTREQKLNIFLKDNQFRHLLVVKLKDKEQQAIIKISVSALGELYYSDIHQTFQRFGTIKQLSIANHVAYIRYSNVVSAYLAVKVLDGLELQRGFKLSIEWCTQFPEHKELQGKIVRKYEILLEGGQFKLASRIIGPGGAALKKIIERATPKHSEPMAKIRLRGKGSGYREPPYHKESDEVLTLFVSSKNLVVFESICADIDVLLDKITQDYKYYIEHKLKKKAEGIAYRVIEEENGTAPMFIRQRNLEEYSFTLNEGTPLAVSTIEAFIDARIDARKKGKFKEADAIRDKLKKKGISLIDGSNGTKWKYLTS